MRLAELAGLMGLAGLAELRGGSWGSRGSLSFMTLPLHHSTMLSLNFILNTEVFFDHFL